MDKIPALSGDKMFGHQIEVGYFDQELAQFNSSNTVIEEIWNEYPELTRTEVRTALGCFLFNGDEVFKEVGVLSGGEKVRLTLVKLMLAQPNFLIMDEPTNHLDLLGKEALENTLMEYDGTMLFVSHDRYFISKMATSILYIDDGVAEFYPFSYQDYVERRKNEEKPVEEPKKEKKVEVKRERFVNVPREIKKLETKIEQKEKEIDALRELQFDPEYYHDYQKMNQLDEQIDDVNNEIENLMAKWEELSEMLE